MDWFSAGAKDIPALLAAGLHRHHPEVTEAEISDICECLHPESYAEISQALGALAFPAFTARYEQTMKDLRAKGESPKA